MLNTTFRFLAIILVTIILFVADILVGSVEISFSDVVSVLFGRGDLDSNWSVIIFHFRLPKALTAILAGAALSVSGLQMQTIFRNPLAGPYVLGISAGAGLGVALLLMGAVFLSSIGLNFVGGNFIIAFAAWIGAAFILLIILAVSARIKDVMTVLILGILFGSAASAVVNILQYFSDAAMLKSFVIWTMGSLGGVTQAQLIVFVPAVLVGFLLAFVAIKDLNLFLLGENYAKSLGLNFIRSRLIIFVSTSLLAGTVTAFCGPIGFVGVVVPHLARMFFRTSNHKILVPACVVLGAMVMLCSDVISQLPGSQYVLPINSVTAIIGVPVIIRIIISKQKIINS